MNFPFKFFLFFFYLFFSLGFRVIPQRWGITSENPYLWIKFCDGQRFHEFSNNFPETDPLIELETLTRQDIAEAIAHEINDYDNTSLRLGIYPENPDTPPESLFFTKENSEDRIIEVCTGSVGTTASGYASTRMRGNTIVGCRITIQDDRIGRSYRKILAHELGHCLGLLHPQESVHALMSYFSTGGYNYKIDDLMGIAHLYPRNFDSSEAVTFGMKCTLAR